jgi:hypothetical protein
MRFKWLALTFFLGFVVVLDPTQTPAQPGQDKGGKKKGGGFGPGGFNPGGGAYSAGLPGAGSSFQPNSLPTPAPNFGGNNNFGGGPGGGFNRNPMGGGGGGPGGFGGNPADGMWFGLQRATNSMGDSVDTSQLPPDARDRISQRLGAPLPDGTITRDQFYSIYAQNAGNQGGRGRGPSGPQPPAVVVMMPPADQFGSRDRNRFDSGPDNYDNGGNLTQNEGKGPRDRKNEKKEVEEDKPALRYGKIPKEVLEAYPWFEEYDLDKDGQVALWEWRKCGGSISEFYEKDLNGDGLITADELVRWKMRNDLVAKETAIMNGEERPKLAEMDRKGGPGGPGGPRGGKPGNATEGSGSDKGDKGEKADKDEKETVEKPLEKREPKKPNPFMDGGNKDDKPTPRRKN